MTRLDPNIYKKENIKDEKERAFVGGMEAACDAIDAFVTCKGFGLELEMKGDGEFSTFATLQKEMIYKIMNDFKIWLESDVEEYIANVMANEAAEEMGND